MLFGHTEWVWEISILNTSDHILSVSTDGSLKLWNLESGARIKEFFNEFQEDGDLK